MTTKMFGNSLFWFEKKALYLCHYAESESCVYLFRNVSDVTLRLLSLFVPPLIFLIFDFVMSPAKPL